MTARYDVSMTIENDHILVRYGGWYKKYELDADPGDVSRFVAAIIKMNVEKVQRELTTQSQANPAPKAGNKG